MTAIVHRLQDAVTDWDGSQEVDGAPLVKPLTCGEAREIILALEASDASELDATDGAHPAWWRGHDHGADAICRAVNDILDGKDTGPGAAREPWESTRRRMVDAARDIARFRSRIAELERQIHPDNLCGAPQGAVNTEVESLIGRLRRIADHDWRISLLAHTSDTAAEAASVIARLRKERDYAVSWANLSVIQVKEWADGEIEALKAENERWQRQMRENYEAFCAMRNDLNELFPIQSAEADLLDGPSMSIACAAIVDSARAWAKARDAKDDSR